MSDKPIPEWKRRQLEKEERERKFKEEQEAKKKGTLADISSSYQSGREASEANAQKEQGELKKKLDEQNVREDELRAKLEQEPGYVDRMTDEERQLYEYMSREGRLSKKY